MGKGSEAANMGNLQCYSASLRKISKGLGVTAPEFSTCAALQQPKPAPATVHDQGPMPEQAAIATHKPSSR